MADIELSESGTATTVREGDRIVIRIPENATTGYRWEPRSVAEHLELEGDEFVPPGALQPGASGQRAITLRAVRRGSGQSEFVLRRPWEDSEPVDFWRVTVTVV